MRTLLTRRAGKPGTKKLMQEYGEKLICVRYRYDEELRQRIKTVEIAVERIAWRRRREEHDGSTVVRFRIAEKEDLLRRAVLLAGGRWDEASDTWMLPRKAAIALGLTARFHRR